MSEPDATLDAPGAGAADPAVCEALRTGERFAERYVVRGEVGRGGMGTVFRVEDEMLGGEVIALKVLDHASPTALERFRREVLLARRITSPQVARIYDFGSYRGTSYLTMEFVAGRSLGEVLRVEQGLGPARIVELGTAIAQGLRAAHEAGVIHRDLKPDNVLVADDGRVVVTDFGIARALARAAEPHLTAGIMGTPHYMAPEQALGRALDARADLFSLGVLLFECASGRLPFEGDSAVAALLSRVQAAPVELSAVCSAPPALASLVMELLARDPNDRPASAQAVLTRLGAIGSSLEEGALASSPRPAVVRPPGEPSPRRTGSRSTPGSRTGGAPREREQLLAVVPFEHRGDPRDRPIADAVRDELVDLIARTRGLSAIAKSASEDASVAQSLGATHLVEASVATSSGKLRATVRLLDQASGRQLWTERVEGDCADPFTGPERAAQRIAEALRLALETVAAPSRVPPEAVDAFVQARARMRTMSARDTQEVLGLLDRALELAPRFPPALALRAMACVRGWFWPKKVLTKDWSEEVRASVASALTHASHVAETHHAAGLVAWHEGRLREAASSARAALSAAPTYPDAMAFLAQLELEAGRAERGLERLAVARELEPTLLVGISEPMRWHGLYGDTSEFERLAAVLERAQPNGFLAAPILLRAGAWRGRRDWVERGVTLLSHHRGPSEEALRSYARIALDPSAEHDLPDPAVFARTSPRFATLAFQFIAEGAMLAGRPDEALVALTNASVSALADLTWVDRCPLLAPIRGAEAFAVARAKVLARVESTWL
jgi:TolB-like protein/predicted Ser/Thr protein kinase